MDFTTITACGECCSGCTKKAGGICQGCIESDGHCIEWEHLTVVQYINVQDSIMYNSVDCVRNSLVSG